MALLLRSEDLKGLISIEEAITAVENGFRDQGRQPQFSYRASGSWRVIGGLTSTLAAASI